MNVLAEEDLRTTVNHGNGLFGFSGNQISSEWSLGLDVSYLLNTNLSIIKATTIHFT